MYLPSYLPESTMFVHSSRRALILLSILCDFNSAMGELY